MCGGLCACVVSLWLCRFFYHLCLAPARLPLTPSPLRRTQGLSADMLATDLAEYLVRKVRPPPQSSRPLHIRSCACTALLAVHTPRAHAHMQRHAHNCTPTNTRPRARARAERAVPRDAPHQRRRRQDGRGPRLHAVGPQRRRPAHHPPPLRGRRQAGAAWGRGEGERGAGRCAGQGGVLCGAVGHGGCACCAARCVANDAGRVCSPRARALHRRRRARQVWDFSRSADARDTEGGASKRSLVEQVAKMRAYLAATE